MEWSEIVDNPYLKDLPFKIEQDRYGNILMSPASNRHGRIQYRIARKLERCAEGGHVFVECSVRTALGVKVPDVVWHSDAFFARHGDLTPFPEAPELCVEVLSPSNAGSETWEKMRLYFESGAVEVWTCDESGLVEFYGPDGRLDASAIAPDFPTEIA
ncbi:MAG: Uma2 family endonuclease [Lacipirellulaceae bacterium]